MKQLWNKIFGKGWYGLATTGNVYTDVTIRLNYLGQKPRLNPKDRSRANAELQKLPTADRQNCPHQVITTVQEVKNTFNAINALQNPAQAANHAQAVSTYGNILGNNPAMNNADDGYVAIPGNAAYGDTPRSGDGKPVVKYDTVLPTNPPAPFVVYSELGAAPAAYGDVPRDQAGTNSTDDGYTNLPVTQNGNRM